jgi:hypothetical protein
VKASKRKIACIGKFKIKLDMIGYKSMLRSMDIDGVIGTIDGLIVDIEHAKRHRRDYHIKVFMAQLKAAKKIKLTQKIMP